MNSDQSFALLRDKIRKRLLKYMRKAFYMLPKIDKPRILDIGCGSGIRTIELARLDQGEVIGIDIDQHALDEFVTKVAESGLGARVKVLNCSLMNMDFPDESFDLIWSEGSISMPSASKKGSGNGNSSLNRVVSWSFMMSKVMLRRNWNRYLNVVTIC
jgi:ubiquinone/menaquinone biosynthesis C-methylase UbiE